MVKQNLLQLGYKVQNVRGIFKNLYSYNKLCYSQWYQSPGI